MGSFTSKAPCREADPWLFDQFNLDLAQPALNYCSRCIFWEECESLVQPKPSFYDGVVAGKVWRNGRILAKLDATSPYRLIVGEEPDEDIDAMEFRGSELLGNRDELFFSRKESGNRGEQTSKEDL
jgi:WhiB family transcriptional regulator, redox-sensing transcriptional regulator